MRPRRRKSPTSIDAQMPPPSIWHHAPGPGRPTFSGARTDTPSAGARAPTHPARPAVRRAARPAHKPPTAGATTTARPRRAGRAVRPGRRKSPTSTDARMPAARQPAPRSKSRRRAVVSPAPAPTLPRLGQEPPKYPARPVPPRRVSTGGWWADAQVPPTRQPTPRPRSRRQAVLLRRPHQHLRGRSEGDRRTRHGRYGPGGWWAGARRGRYGPGRCLPADGGRPGGSGDGRLQGAAPTPPRPAADRQPVGRRPWRWQRLMFGPHARLRFPHGESRR